MIVVGALLATLAAPQAERELVDRVVAVVNEDIITHLELQAAAQPYLLSDQNAQQRRKALEDVLEQLISERLISQQLEEAKITISDNDLERAIQDILRQNNISQEQLEEAVTARGLSMTQYREDIRNQLMRLKLIEAKVRSKVIIPEADVQAEYERLTRSEPLVEKVTIRHIFLPWKADATQKQRKEILGKLANIRGRILKGEAFEKLAKEMSEGPTASTGGSLGELEEGSLLPELAKGLKGLPAGELSQPIATQTGGHIVLVEKRVRVPKTTLESLRPQIERDLQRKSLERQMKVWIGDLRRQSAISIRLDETPKN